MKKTINGKEVKVTKAGYLYVDNVKMSWYKNSPLLNVAEKEGLKEYEEICKNWINKNWRLSF